jgi:hypothetical protein
MCKFSKHTSLNVIALISVVCPHASFSHSGISAGAAPRESVEVRMIVITRGADVDDSTFER